MGTRWTVYCHIHAATGRRYVGLTKQIWQERWKNHVHKSRKSKGGRWHFPNAIRKYGPDAFLHEVLETCTNLDVANIAEQSWIEFYDTRSPEKGFNLAKGGGNPMYKRPPPMFTQQHRARLAAARCGVAIDPATRQKISASQRGKPRNPGSIAKSAASRKGIELSPEHRANIGAAQRGKKRTLEHVESVRMALLARPKAMHCKRGHSLDDAYISGDRRFCRICAAARSARYNAKKRGRT